MFVQGCIYRELCIQNVHESIKSTNLLENHSLRKGYIGIYISLGYVLAILVLNWSKWIGQLWHNMIQYVIYCCNELFYFVCIFIFSLR